MELLRSAVVAAGGLALTACGVAQPTEVTPLLVQMTETLTLAPTITPTEAPTATEAPIDERQISADGRIYYNEARLYDGLFTVNEEQTGYLYGQLLRSLYEINYWGENRRFLTHFPTLDAFRDYALTGQPVSDMWVAIDYPGTGLQFPRQATWTPVESVDLSTIATAINRITYEDALSGTFPEGKYFSIGWAGGELMIERTEIEGRVVPRFVFRRRDGLYDAPEEGVLGLSEDYPPRTQLGVRNSARQVVVLVCR
jgi:hypothetical protein